MKRKIIRLCKTCKGKPSYMFVYDASYCADCNIWLEDKCSDLECELCVPRPDKPLTDN